MHLKGERRTCACGKARGRAVDLRSDRPPGAYEAVRYGRDAFIAHHRGSRHSSGLPLISKTWSFAQQVLAGPHRYGNTSRSGAGAAGARLDWLCGRRVLHSQRLLVLQQKKLDIGIFCLVYLGLLNRRNSRTQSPKSQKRISGTQPATVANTLPTVQCASRSVIQHNCFSLKIATTVRFVRMR